MAEAMVLFLPPQLEPLGLVDLPRRVENVVGPEHHLAIASALREADTFLDQAIADTEAACRTLDVQQPELGNGLRFGDAEDCSHDLAVTLGHPAPIPFRVILFHEDSEDR